MKISHKYIFIGLIALALSSCSEFVRVQKSTDMSLKYAYAKKCYNEGKFSKASELLEDVVPFYKGRMEGSPSLILLANAYYNQDRMSAASSCYTSYYSIYPKGEHAEEARFKAGESLANIAPDPRLDQTDTYKAIELLQSYLDYYPNGKYAKVAEKVLFGLQDRLAEKEYLAAKLYYRLGIYMGNNYKSCIITANQAIKDFPYSKWREDLQYLILKAAYKEAIQSVSSKEQERLRTAVDKYYEYINEYPKGKYVEDANKIFAKVSKLIRE